MKDLQVCASGGAGEAEVRVRVAPGVRAPCRRGVGAGSVIPPRPPFVRQLLCVSLSGCSFSVSVSCAEAVGNVCGGMLGLEQGPEAGQSPALAGVRLLIQVSFCCSMCLLCASRRLSWSVQTG